MLNPYYLARTNVGHWLARVFRDCLKGKREAEPFEEWVTCVSKHDTIGITLTPEHSIEISLIHLQPCASVADSTLDTALWTESNRLVNAAAAWQIRRVMPIEAASMDEAGLVKMTSPELARRFKALPILLVLRGGNEMLRQLSLELLSADAFAGLTLLERRAVHNVLGDRPKGWTNAQLSLYAERERELVAAAHETSNENSQDALYSARLPVTFSAYAQEPRGWLD